MKQTLLLSFLLVVFSAVFAQTNQWTCVSGDYLVNYTGIYGIKGVSSPTNLPGFRERAVSWADPSGNLWVFGGLGGGASTYGYLNDLWKFTVATGQWTWMSGSNETYQRGSYGTRGIASPNNVPSARNGAFAFTDASGNFWLFGGLEFSASGSGALNDLWKYTPSTNQWTWMSGDTIQDQRGIYGVQGMSAVVNKPGTRYDGATGSIDAAGNIWLYGGRGWGSNGEFGSLSDLWKYSLSSGQWTWVSGADVPSQNGVYGTRGVPAATNRPGARFRPDGWMDVSGNFWLFGGQSISGNVNDLWKYDVSTNLWTWMSGNNISDQGGIYGTKGVANPANTPGARQDATTLRDAAGNLLLFGGRGRGLANQPVGVLNDLWSYSPLSGQWTWISGDSSIYAYAQYGSKGVSAATNKPGGRSGMVSWIDPTGNLWIHGGRGIYYYAQFFPPDVPLTDGLRDMWKYSLSAAPNIIGSFTARKESQGVSLNWTSSPDQNIRSFVVERYNGTVTGYQSIGTILATGSSSRYSFTDNTPLAGTNFYRIRQVDQIGSTSYSSIAQVDMNQYTTQFSIYQNPVQNVLQLVVQLPVKQKLMVQVRDVNGHVLIRQEQTGYAGRASFSVPVDRLSQGTYLIQVQSESVNLTKTFIKQ